MSLELTGKILFIGERQQVTEKFAKRIFTIETKAGQYPEMAALQFVQDRTDLIDPFKVGDNVRVHFNIKSREYNNQYYTELTAWGIANADVQQQSQLVSAPVPNGQQKPKKPGANASLQEVQEYQRQTNDPGAYYPATNEGDDLPF